MNTLVISSFVLGLAVSLHCAGMCGPLVCARFAINSKSKVRGFVLMQLGRVTTYAILGAGAATLGKAISLGSSQQKISLIAGALILAIYFMPKKQKAWFQQRLPVNPMAASLRKRVALLMKSDGIFASLGLGLLNGLLPCGVVYAALAAAAGAGSMELGALMMFAFGLGNVPVLILSAGAGMLIKSSVIRKYSIPMAVLCTASLLILRGMALGIPYVSPALETETGVVADCCAAK